MSSKQDTRTFTQAGTAADPVTGTVKVRFTTSVSHGERMKKLGYTDIALVELPERLTKTDAIAYLLATKPAGVNLDVLAAKEIAIVEQTVRANGEGTGRKRGRPAHEKTAEEIDAAAAKVLAKATKKAERETVRAAKALEVATRKAARETARLAKIATAKTKTETIVTKVVKAAKKAKATKATASATE